MISQNLQQLARFTEKKKVLFSFIDMNRKASGAAAGRGAVHAILLVMLLCKCLRGG